MAVPGPVTSAMSVGAHQLVRECDARLVTSAAEVVEEVGALGVDLATRPQVPETWRDLLGPVAGAVLDVLSRRPLSVEEVAAEAGVTVEDAAALLPTLIRCGAAERVGRRYGAVRRAVWEQRTVLPPVR
jgi:DNA processing protein